MFSWLKKKKGPVLSFADNEAAFAHACGIGYRHLLGAVVPALIREDGGRGNDGEHLFLISLAGVGGGMNFWSCTLKEATTYPRPGDLVGFRIVTIASDLPQEASLIGYIACKLEPVFVPHKGWVVSQSYTPTDLKPALHL
ncbi:hypothetical protein [Geomesophilobacter sediminis]|uniref:Uncharacterized protein n=1 Tax=Geomesophilobacter sediminis TaxID=2798584 RepID=A0A8J7IZS0_9BACT|nr:hypothetical protein [Geomesophilobacter sediminis]MBJ6725627.1 hypothetical protein [Geomesophilobacter sediminis]